MKKQRKKYIFLALIFIIAIISLTIYLWQKPQSYAHEQVKHYYDYKYTDQEIAKLKISDKNFIYYYASDGKRYVFQDLSVFQSWFPDYPIDDLAFASSESMYDSPLGGNVFLRPGSLLQSETLLDTFIVFKNGHISPVADEKLLDEYYGADWKNKVVVLPDYYFSQYKIEKPIKSASDFPEIPPNLTIDQDLMNK